MADDNEIRGGAAPALAAHSKDASTAGPTPASSATGEPMPPKTSFRDGIADAIDAVSAQGARVATPAADFVREQPFAALAVMGVACFAFGLLLGRR